MSKGCKIETTSLFLHIIAMICMLCDHLWGTIVPGNDWMTCVGRLAFPIFAFLIVEGYFHTRNLRKYTTRLLVCAILSEIPFNLALSGSFIYPFHQNVLWTFLIAIGMIHWNEKAKSLKCWKRIAAAGASLIVGVLLGLLTMADYYHAGVLTVLAFYFFRGRNWRAYLGQFVSLAYIHFEMIGGLVYEISLAGQFFSFPRQGFALLALIPIWLYRGKQGYHSKWLQYTYYAFYPIQLLILGLIIRF